MPTVEDQEEFCENCKNDIRSPRETKKLRLPNKTMRTGLDVWVCPVCDLGESVLKMTHDKK